MNCWLRATMGVMRANRSAVHEFPSRLFVLLVPSVPSCFSEIGFLTARYEHRGNALHVT